VSNGDYLVGIDGELRVAPWENGPALLNQRVARLQFYGTEVVQPFVVMALQRELSKLQGVKAYTTVDHLSGKQIAEATVALPPFVEQQRIVGKVDELMALCDALERESADAMAAHQALVETLLATLT
jgi:type I restriction enzyme S subunit